MNRPTSGAQPDGRKVERVLSNGKRVFAHAFKLALVRHCLEPGVSVAGLALEHGVNANLLRKWITKHRKEVEPVAGAALLPVILRADTVPALTSESTTQAAPCATGCIEIEAFGACVRLQGEVDARQLRIVLDALARQR